MRSRLSALCALSALLSGCATYPAVGTPATGERLSVQTRVASHTYIERQKVGDVQYTDRAGRNLGRAEVYENVQRTSHCLLWSPAQGDKTIDDQDFFRIAGDVQAAKEIERVRNNAVTLNRVGIILALAGGASLVAGAYMDISKSPGKYVGAWSVLLPVGGIMAYFGKGRLEPEYHVLDRERAEKAAEAYNASLGDAPSDDAR